MNAEVPRRAPRSLYLTRARYNTSARFRIGDSFATFSGRDGDTTDTAARVTRSRGDRLHYGYLTWKSSFVTDARAAYPSLARAYTLLRSNSPSANKVDSDRVSFAYHSRRREPAIF